MRILRILVPLCLVFASTYGQITTPQIKANFGVDADLRANYFNNFIISGNDDWFTFPGTPGTGQSVIDTTGAVSIVARYATDMNFRKIPFFRTMKYPAYTVVNNRLLIDAVFIRDYHDQDSTVFGGGSKNGDNPANWITPLVQSVPDKNDILDMFVHVRREGPTSNYPLWLFGGVSIESTSGNRYFDFEMYQTDIYYDRPSQKFYGFGPDAGHTSWKFDASGNVTQPGDIVFSADYGSSSIASLEARIWVNKNDLSIIPANFDWNGTFDGANAGSQYGYAGIKPKAAGAFYTGADSPANTWAGPFGLIRADNSFTTTYTTRQFMEFSVNLTLLGLDPVTLLGGSGACGMPFRRVLVKSRASTSFTAALKDFVGPFDFFLAPRADASADVPLYCGTIGVSQLTVNNAVPTSVYDWATPDGNIVGTSSGPNITVNAPGTYIVTQRLQAACTPYATDTVQVVFDPGCVVLADHEYNLKGDLKGEQAQLSWNAPVNENVKYYEVERSTDGIHYTNTGKVYANGTTSYHATDNIGGLSSPYVYYRLKVTNENNAVSYSKAIKLSLQSTGTSDMRILRNPASESTQISITSASDRDMTLSVYDFTGRLMYSLDTRVAAGNNIINLDNIRNWPRGMYAVKVSMGEDRYTEKLVISR